YCCYFTMSYCFFSQYSLLFHDLHSFPTRRSSDLIIQSGLVLRLSPRYYFFLKYSRIHSNILVILVFRILINKPDGNFLFPDNYQFTKLVCFYVLIWWWII